MGVSRMPPGEQYVTAREIADRVGLSTDTILRYYRDGKIPGRRMPGQIRPVRFLWSEVEAAFNGIADQAAEQAREEWAGRVRGAGGVSAQRGSDLPHGQRAVGDPVPRRARPAAAADGLPDAR